MKKVTYSCDICRDETPKERLYGCHFTDLKNFKLKSADSTDGVHICVDCLDQIKEQVLKPREKEERARRSAETAAHAASCE